MGQHWPSRLCEGTDGGSKLGPLQEHLEALEEAVLEYLEASYYRNSRSSTQAAMRQFALTPQNPEAQMPEPYRIWLQCRANDTLWWSGGIADQPHILMREFNRCRIAEKIFGEQLENYRAIISGG